MRRWAIGVLAVLAVLVVAVPAQAKGEASKVTISNGGSGGMGPGPGSGGSGGGGGGGTIAILASTIHLTGTDAAPWLGDTGIFQETQAHPAAKALGPSLDVRMGYTCGDRGGTLSQRLYPYAKGGAVVHTMPGQQFCDGSLMGTWWHVAPQSMGLLRSHGLPATMPTAVEAGSGAASGSSASGGSTSTREETVAAGSSSVPVLPIAVGIIAVAAVLGLAVLQRRRRTVAA
jgi:hypothetical protein